MSLLRGRLPPRRSRADALFFARAYLGSPTTRAHGRPFRPPPARAAVPVAAGFSPAFVRERGWDALLCGRRLALRRAFDRSAWSRLAGEGDGSALLGLGRLRPLHFRLRLRHRSEFGL